MRCVIFILICLLAAIPCSARIITVDDDGPADFNNIQAAIDDSNDGDIIIVSPGTYTGDGNRDIDYNGKAITVRSIDPNDPNIVAATIIDPQGSEGNYHRGFYFHSGEDSNSILNGLTITNGYAANGGGIYCEGSSPTLTNCTFIENSARYMGGGMWNHRGSPIVTNCTFSGNSVEYIGGGMFNTADARPTLTNCTFTGNSGDWGGGMGADGSAFPILINCTFIGNSASWGGGMFNLDSSSPILTDCTFRNNSANKGGGMFNTEDSNPTLTNCSFSANSASDEAGGMYNEDHCSPTLTNCTFSKNTALTGGGMYNENSSPTLNKCDFIENSADNGWCGYGGGMYNSSSSPAIVDCLFGNNSAVDDGGGICNWDNSSPILTNCTFNENSGDAGGAMINHKKSNPMLTKCTFIGNFADHGGAVYNNDSNLTMSNCMFSGNWSGWKGEGYDRGEYNTWTYKQVVFHYSNPTLTCCTFSGNSADLHNRGALEINASNATVNNCIFWTDSDSSETDESAQIDLCNGGKLVINYSCVEGWTGILGGLGNHGEDPLFVNANGDDNIAGTEDDNLSLLPDSSCIDAGDPNYVPEPDETDLDDKPRVIGDRIDMGAYEYNPPILAEARIVPRTINLASKGKWINGYIWLPQGYNITDIDPNSIFLEDEIQPDRFSVDKEEQVAIATFRRSNVQTILDIGNIELTITGQLTDGTAFAATDIIKVINNARQKTANQRILY